METTIGLGALRLREALGWLGWASTSPNLRAMDKKDGKWMMTNKYIYLFIYLFIYFYFVYLLCLYLYSYLYYHIYTSIFIVLYLHLSLYIIFIFIFIYHIYSYLYVLHYHHHRFEANNEAKKADLQFHFSRLWGSNWLKLVILVAVAADHAMFSQAVLTIDISSINLWSLPWPVNQTPFPSFNYRHMIYLQCVYILPSGKLT